jgi:hypothetical protein
MITIFLKLLNRLLKVMASHPSLSVKRISLKGCKTCLLNKMSHLKNDNKGLAQMKGVKVMLEMMLIPLSQGLWGTKSLTPKTKYFLTLISRILIT